MRKLVLIAVTVATLLLGSIAPVFAAHGSTGCPVAASWTSGTPGNSWVWFACSKGN